MFNWFKNKKIVKKHQFDDLLELEQGLNILQNEHKLLEEKLKLIKYTNAEKFLETFFLKEKDGYTLSLKNYVYRGVFKETEHYMPKDFVFFDNAFWFLLNDGLKPGFWSEKSWNLCFRINNK